MSGGSIGDYGYFNMGEWAAVIEPENPVLAELVRDMGDLLHDYDWYISGDTGRDDAEASWKEFKGKWLDGADLEPIVRRILKDTEDSIIHGWREPHAQ